VNFFSLHIGTEEVIYDVMFLHPKNIFLPL